MNGTAEKSELHGDYRKLLRHELERRIQKTPRYSLRAFARDLEISPSRLSEVLSGKQGLSKEAAQKIARGLGFLSKETEIFCDMVEAEHGRAALNRELAKKRLARHQLDASFKQLDVDQFRLISDWYHFAILELLQLNDFRNDVNWIAAALAISPMEASLALQRLERQGLVKTEGDRLVPANPFTASPDGIPSEAIRRAHQQLLSRASTALEVQKVEERDFSTVFVAIDRKMLPEAKKWIRSFRRRFCKKVSTARDKNELYCLSTYFFNVTHTKERQ